MITVLQTPTPVLFSWSREKKESVTLKTKVTEYVYTRFRRVCVRTCFTYLVLSSACGSDSDEHNYT